MIEKSKGQGMDWGIEKDLIGGGAKIEHKRKVRKGPSWVKRRGILRRY